MIHIVSCHIPKTAGSSFRAMLHKMEPGRVYFDYGRQYAISDPEPPTTVGRLARLKRVWPSWFGPAPWHRIIHGHFPATKYRQRFPRARNVTWLRDPVERVVSNYYHWTRKPSPAHSVGWSVKKQGLSVLEFARIPIMRNLQSTYLQGVPLTSFDFVGIQERFDELLPAFFDVVERERIQAPVRNVSPDKAPNARYDLPEEVRAEILDLNSADARLYDDGKALIEARGWISHSASSPPSDARSIDAVS